MCVIHGEAEPAVPRVRLGSGDKQGQHDEAEQLKARVFSRQRSRQVAPHLPMHVCAGHCAEPSRSASQQASAAAPTKQSADLGLFSQARQSRQWLLSESRLG